MAFHFIYNTVAMAITYCFVLMNRAGRLECTDGTRYNFSGLSCPILARRSILPESWSGDKDRSFMTVLPQQGPVVLIRNICRAVSASIERSGSLSGGVSEKVLRTCGRG